MSKRLKIGIWFWCCLLALSLSGQEHRVSIELGGDVGWWVHQLGESELGVYKTHLVLIPSLQAAYLWPVGKWRIGPSIRAGSFRYDNMRSPQDSRRLRDRIMIAREDGSIPFLRYGLRVENHFFQRRNYTFAPAIQYGHFQF